MKQVCPALGGWQFVLTLRTRGRTAAWFIFQREQPTPHRRCRHAQVIFPTAATATADAASAAPVSGIVGGSTAALSCIWRVTNFRWKSFSFGTLIDIDNPTSGPLSILVSTLSNKQRSPLENGEIGRRRSVWAIR